MILSMNQVDPIYNPNMPIAIPFVTLTIIASPKIRTRSHNPEKLTGARTESSLSEILSQPALASGGSESGMSKRARFRARLAWSLGRKCSPLKVSPGWLRDGPKTTQRARHYVADMVRRC